MDREHDVYICCKVSEHPTLDRKVRKERVADMQLVVMRTV